MTPKVQDILSRYSADMLRDALDNRFAELAIDATKSGNYSLRQPVPQATPTIQGFSRGGLIHVFQDGSPGVYAVADTPLTPAVVTAERPGFGVRAIQMTPEGQMQLRNQMLQADWERSLAMSEAERDALQGARSAVMHPQPVQVSPVGSSPADNVRVVSGVRKDAILTKSDDDAMLEAVLTGKDTKKYIDDRVRALRNGEDLRTFQQMLIDKGYDLHRFGADGKIGKETRAAARKYYNDIANQAKESAVVETPKHAAAKEPLPDLSIEQLSDAITQQNAVVMEPKQESLARTTEEQIPSFAEYMYTSGQLGALRRLSNLGSVGVNYVNGMLNPHGNNASLSEGARRQMVGAALAGYDSSGKWHITDTEHQNLGGMQGHSGEEFRADTGVKGFIKQAMDAPYHNVYGQSGHVSNSGETFDPGLDEENPDAYTYNNVWRGDKVVEVLDDGAGTATLQDAIKEYREARDSGAGIKQALESAASKRGVDVQPGKTSRVNEKKMRKYRNEYQKVISDPKRLARYNAKVAKLKKTK